MDTFFTSRLGEIYALGTAIFWTITALSFEFAGKRVGTLSLNLIRITIGFLLLSLYSWITRGILLPIDAPPSLWFWLGASGLVGFVIGDILLFQAFIEIGARISMLIYSAVPPLSAVLGWIFLHETIRPRGLLGMAITLTGIALVVLERGTPKEGNLPPPGSQDPTDGIPSQPSLGSPTHSPSDPNLSRASSASQAQAPSPAVSSRFRHPVRGVLLAFGGALGQAVGLILSKHGAPSFNAFAATQIRCLAGILGFGLLVLVTRHTGHLFTAVRDRKAMRGILLGSFFGPFLGVSFSLLAIQHTSTGVASTIMALVPVLIIWPSHLLFQEPVRSREVLGALIAVSGTVLLFFR
ncbi:MAG: hypothetical protein Kow009_00270 [Spirochaetales bacterium]